MFSRTRLTGPALSCCVAGSCFASCVGCRWRFCPRWKVAVGRTKFSFLHDIETHVRFLVSLPVLLLAEITVHRRLRPAVRNFVDRHIVSPDELPKFDAAIDSAMRMRNSVLAEVVLLVLVFTGGIWIWRNEVALGVASWYASPMGGRCI